MASPTSLLKGARAFARDMPREAMAPGFLWDVVDFVPQVIDAPLTSRGGWQWGSSAGAAADYEAGILAYYSTGEKHLAAANGALYEIDLDPPYAITARGAVPVARQNPVMLFDQVIWMDGTGAAAPSLVPAVGAPVVLTAPKVKVGTIWGHYFVGGNAVGAEDTVYFSPPSNVTLPWDANALARTASTVTGLAALRNAVLVFHAASVERLRGSRPPAGTDKGDLVLEPLFNQVGTTEPRSIAYWQENVIFADEHGVHITDGAVLRNLVQQGQIQSYWRNIYANRVRMSAAVFLDYYVITLLRDVPRPPVPLLDSEPGIGVMDRPPVPNFDPRLDSTTLVCDLTTRQWFRLSNVFPVAMWASGGTFGMERLWGAHYTTHRLARYSPMFFPVLTGLSQQDADGTNVLPSLETPYYKLAAEGRKRIRFAYLSYDARTVAPGDVLQVGYILSPQDAGFTTAGVLPQTTRYSRYRLPVGKFPYGIAFKVSQFAPTQVTRISDLAVDAHAAERSRV